MRSRDHTNSIAGHGRSASRYRAAPGDPSPAMSNSPRDWALPPGRASHVVESAKNPFDWAKGLMQPAPKPLAKGREHAYRPNIQCDWAIPLMRGNVRHQRYCPIAPRICSGPAPGDHDLHQENGHDLNTQNGGGPGRVVRRLRRGHLPLATIRPGTPFGRHRPRAARRPCRTS